MNRVLFLLILCMYIPYIGLCQKPIQPKYFNNLSKDKSRLLYNRALGYSAGGNSYNFMALRGFIDANNQAYICGDESSIAYQIAIIDNLINSARLSKKMPESNYKHKDSFMGWIAKRTNSKNAGSIGQEVPLYESYTFYPVTKFLYLLKENGWIDVSENNYNWWVKTKTFVENNIWSKWYERSYNIYKKPNRIFLRNRVHIASHWAGIAMYLNQITESHNIQVQTKKLQKDYDLLLKNNIKQSKAAPNTIVWNRTFDNVFKTDAIADPNKVVQDVSHGNHVVSYVIDAHEMGNKYWTEGIIDMFANTLNNIIYDGDNKLFRDNVDGSQIQQRIGSGNFVGDGWIKLSKYNKKTKNIFLEFSKNTKLIEVHYQEQQFEAFKMRSCTL